VQFVFDIRKAIAATGFLCKLNEGQLNVLHLIKMLYAADRTALITWHRTITGDKFYSMKNGPVLSRIYDLMCGRVFGSDMEAWDEVFNPRDGNIISLKIEDVDLGSLSEREMELLEKAFKKFKNVPAGQLVAFLHKVLPEWKDPGNSSVPIDPRDILFQSGLTEQEVNEIEQELDLVQSAKVALQVPQLAI
jgi:uncharacterized phage-associated protein